MKKILKWFFRILLILIGLIIILLIVIPALFKDEMLAKVKHEINNNVNAKVEFADFNLSLIKSFPNLNLGLKEVSVKGIDRFQDDTLVYFESFNVQVDLLSALKKNVVVKGIVLNKPFINGIVLEDSTTNWDITVPSEEVADSVPVPEKAEPEVELTEEKEKSGDSGYRVDLQKFQIKNARINYNDQTSNMLASIGDFNLLIKGDLGTDYTDVNIKTSVDAINVKMGPVKYLKDATFGFNATIGANMNDMIFTFKDNQLSINDIVLGFEGMVEMQEEDMNVDVKFATRKTSFKSLLSMVPAIYLEGFEDLKTKGNLSLEGDIKGTYNDSLNQMPLANLRLIVEDAMFQYPDLPKSVENINIDLSVFYDGVVNDNTKVDLNKFHVELADNPFDIAVHVRTPFSDPYVEGTIDGHIILNTLADALPLDEMSLDGEITADVDIAGNLSTIENEKYEDFKAKGQLKIKDFVFESPDLPAAFKIIETTFNFTPQYLELKSFMSEIGESDFSLNGKIENYIAYALSDGTLRGDLYFKSKNINANEFMAEDTQTETAQEIQEETSEESTQDTVTTGTVVVVPEKIDFKLISELDNILYDKMEITNLKGTFLIKDQKLMMNNLSMDLLDGKFGLSGEYNTQNIEKPTATMALDIQDIEIESALNSFSMLESLAPILKHCKGKVSIKFDYMSLLDSEMSPVLNSIEGYGRIQSKSIQVVDSKTLDKLTELLKLGKDYNNEFKDINISFKVSEGRIFVEPFDINLEDIKMTVGGSHGIDQTLDYDIALDVPRKYFGSAANDVLDGLLKQAADKGVKVDVSESIKVKARVVGTTTDPKVTLNYKEDSGDSKSSVKKELTEKAKEELEKKGREELEAEAQKIIDDAEKEAAKIKQEARVAADKAIEEGNKQADDLVKKASKEGMLAKIAAEKTADKLKAEARKKADDIIKAADVKADKIVEEARIKADKIRKEE